MLAATLLAASLAVTSVEPEVQPEGRFMIPPGRMAFVREVLGNDPPPPDGCTCTELSIRRDRIVAEYRCPGTPRAVLELADPGAREPSLRTERFAVFVRTHDFPQALLDALVARIRAREQEWRWTTPDLALEGEPPPPPIAGIALVLALAVVALHAALDRARPAPHPLRETPSIRNIAWAAVVFAIMLASLEMLVPDPPLHLDTARDLLLARDLRAGHGVLSAVPTSFSHARLFHGGPWLRLLQGALAVDVPLRGVRFAVHLLQALSVALVHWGARRQAGPAAAAIAAGLQAIGMLVIIEAPVLWNPSLLPLPLAVVGLGLLGCARTGRVAPVVCASAALGLSAQLHVVVAVLFPLVLAAVVATARRPALAVVAAAAAACAGFTAGSWPAAALDLAVFAAHPSLAAVPAAAAAAGWVARRRLLAMSPERRVEAVLLAAAAVALLTLVVGAWFVESIEPRYAAPCLATWPLAIAVVGARAASVLSPTRRTMPRADLAAVALVGVALWTWAQGAGRRWGPLPRWTLYDAETLAPALRREGFSFGYLFRHLRTLDDPRGLLASIASLDAASIAVGPPDGTEDDVVIVKAPRAAAIDPVPGWLVIPLRGDFVAIAARVPFALRWERFESCVDLGPGAAPVCRTDSLAPPEPTSFVALAYPMLSRATDRSPPGGAARIRITAEARARDGTPTTIVRLPPADSGPSGWRVQHAGGAAPGEVLDLGSGAGRAVVFALEAPHGVRDDDLEWLPPYVETPRTDERLAALLEAWRHGR